MLWSRGEANTSASKEEELQEEEELEEEEAWNGAETQQHGRT